MEALRACDTIGGEARRLNIAPPASNEEVIRVENVLGLTLPLSFRRVLTDFSASIDLSWFLPQEIELPIEFRGIFRGQCSWDLSRLIDIDKGRKGWVENCFSNENDDYDRVWHNKLAFLEVGNGDCLAFDLDYSPDSPIVYLSHDVGEGHGYRLGDNFVDFIDKWSLLGCPGAED